MDIKSIKNVKYDISKKEFDLFAPQFMSRTDIGVIKYTVQRGEVMRIDLVAMSMYNNNISVLESLDILLFINNIDNPLNIVEGMDLIYPPDASSLELYRISNDITIGGNVRNQLSSPNKTTKIDNNRKKFVDSGYALPPVVLDSTMNPVRLEDGKIVIGGLN